MNLKVKLITLMIPVTTMLNAQRPEQNISAAFAFEMKSVAVKGIQMKYYEQGTGDPILFLHGIPSNSYLWRNVVPEVSANGRAIAVDLAGYGQSGIPINGDYSIQHQYDHLKGFIDSLQLKNITLVVNDLGSLYGLKYAVENPANIKKIVFIEAVFMPAEQWYKQLTMKQKMMFGMFQNQKRAKKWIVAKNMIPKMMMKMGIKRKLSKEERDHYLLPYENDSERRMVMLKGPGPATFSPKGKTQVPGDFADEINKMASGLITLNKRVPFLILYASPGMITRNDAISYARTNFGNVTITSVGKGVHFLPEDHPKSIAIAINKFILQ